MTAIVGCNSHKLDKEPRAWLIDRLGIRKAQAKLREIETYFAAMQMFIAAHPTPERIEG